ncbi:unnamed protein product [Closterium sp. NIES-53]
MGRQVLGKGVGESSTDYVRSGGRNERLVGEKAEMSSLDRQIDAEAVRLLCVSLLVCLFGVLLLRGWWLVLVASFSLFKLQELIQDRSRRIQELMQHPDVGAPASAGLSVAGAGARGSWLVARGWWLVAGGLWLVACGPVSFSLTPQELMQHLD